MYADVLRQVESVVDADPCAGLVARIAGGDRVAMEHFYRQFQDHVYRFALVGLADAIAAADVLQATMIRVWTQARDYAGGDLTVWLLGLSWREIAARLPAQPRDPGVPDDGATAASAFPENGAEDVQRVRAALSVLPTTQRLALHLAFAEDMPHEDIADVLDCAEFAARDLILAGQRSLRRLLTP